MSHAVVMHEAGGPEVLRWEERTPGAPGPGEVLLRHAAVGVNFIDVYNRTGLYPVPLPAVIGQEAAGVVLAVGPGVALRAGARVAYAGVLGAYAEERLIPAERLVELPDSVTDVDAAAAMLKGLTADMLLKRVHKVEPGQTVLFTAAAGGVGQLAVRWAKGLGATVIGTVGSEAKVAAAKAAGCDHVLLSDEAGTKVLAARVKELTGGKGVRVAYESVGGPLLDAAIACLAPRGMIVTFGQASGKVPMLDTKVLANGGSLFATRPSIRHYYATSHELQEGAASLFEAMARGHVQAAVGARFGLRDAGKAHEALQGRGTTGATVLLP
jgi:NADPH2:quinone reductase